MGAKAPRVLPDALRQKPGRLGWRDLSRATAKTTFPVWQMNAIGDFTLHGASGPMPKWYGPVGNLFDQFLGAAETDAVLAEWFLRRFSLLDSLYMVPRPGIIGRAIPFGVGAVIGGVGNHFLGRRVVTSSRTAFGPAPAQFPIILDAAPPQKPRKAALPQ